MKSAKESSLDASIKIPVNGYADDMALLGSSHQEVTRILGMLERFLAYYGMELNASKCGYQYLIHQLDPCPPKIRCRWGDIPNYHDSKSYKYLGYYVNTKLDFRYQYKTMTSKMTQACKHFCNRQKQDITMHEAIHYVNSDLISKLRYRMNLISFLKQCLKRIETLLVQVIKRMAGLANSTPTDLLIDQGLYNTFTLQSSIRAEFMQSALQAVDIPCKITSQISYTHIKHHPLFNGIEPFSKAGTSITWPENQFSPLFHGIQSHLNALNMSLLTSFDSKVDLQSRLIQKTLLPLAFYHRLCLRVRKGLTETHIIRLFKKSEESKLVRTF
jgi:hypothetical protein